MSKSPLPKPLRLDGQHILCNGEWHAYVQGLRFGKGGDIPLCEQAAYVVKAANLIPELVASLEFAHIKMAALLPNPDKPDFMVALGRENEADAECLTKAYDAIVDALDKVRSL